MASLAALASTLLGPWLQAGAGFAPSPPPSGKLEDTENPPSSTQASDSPDLLPSTSPSSPASTPTSSPTSNPPRGGLIWLEDPPPEAAPPDASAQPSADPGAPSSTENSLSLSTADTFAQLQPSAFRGSLRLTGALWRRPLPTLSDDGLFNAVLRGIYEKKIAEHYKLEINLFVNAGRSPRPAPAPRPSGSAPVAPGQQAPKPKAPSSGSALGGAFGHAGNRQSPYRFGFLQYKIWERDGLSSALGFDRFFVGWHEGPWSTKFGRFPVSYSVTQIFTPNDFFAPFSATSINQVFKPGIDALQVRRALGDLGTFEVLLNLGYDAQKKAANPTLGAAMMRVTGVWQNFEWGVLGGRVARRFVVGGSMQGDIRGLELRSEGHVGFPDQDPHAPEDPAESAPKKRSKPYLRLSFGPSYTFSWHQLRIGAEYYFDSGGAKVPGYLSRAAQLFPDDIPYLGRNYIGLSSGLQIVPLLQATAMMLCNLDDRSGLFGTFFSYNAGQRSELIAGVYLPWGQGPKFDPKLAQASLGSEFGLGSPTLFLESRVHF